MVIVSLAVEEENLVSKFELVGSFMDEETRFRYMINACTNQINHVVDEVYSQLDVQGYVTTEELAVNLSSVISGLYPDFQPGIHWARLILLMSVARFSRKNGINH